MSAPECVRLPLYLDNELPEEAARAFRDHLLGCFTCTAGLDFALQLKGLTEAARQETAGSAPYVSVGLALPWYTSFWIWLGSRATDALEWAGILAPDCFCTHGTYHGGDPRDFQPDDDQPEAVKRHVEDCAAWFLAEQTGTPPPETRDLGKRVGAVAVGAFVQLDTYGYGTNLCQLHGHAPPRSKPLLRWRRALVAKFQSWRAR